MRLFVRIAETGSFSKAARAAGIGQPTASKQIAALEERLGAQLVQRTSRGLTLTEAGQSFHESAHRHRPRRRWRPDPALTHRSERSPPRGERLSLLHNSLDLYIERTFWRNSSTLFSNSPDFSETDCARFSRSLEDRPVSAAAC